MVLLSEVVDQSAAQIAVKRMFDSLIQIDTKGRYIRHYVGASMGVVVSDGEDSPEVLFKCADEVLYEAKNAVKWF